MLESRETTCFRRKPVQTSRARETRKISLATQALARWSSPMSIPRTHVACWNGVVSEYVFVEVGRPLTVNKS
jgi:hypothetical protein